VTTSASYTTPWDSIRSGQCRRWQAPSQLAGRHASHWRNARWNEFVSWYPGRNATSSISKDVSARSGELSSCLASVNSRRYFVPSAARRRCKVRLLSPSSAGQSAFDGAFHNVTRRSLCFNLAQPLAGGDRHPASKSPPWKRSADNCGSQMSIQVRFGPRLYTRVVPSHIICPAQLWICPHKCSRGGFSRRCSSKAWLPSLRPSA
jgi:hypothetical protein